MTRYKVTDTFTRDVQVSSAESILQELLPPDCKMEFNTKARMLSLLSTEAPRILAQQQFTKNEWSILLILLLSYPHYAPHEVLLASITSLCPADCRKRLHETQQLGPKALKRELKPVHRALSGLRAKLDTCLLI